MNFLGDFHVVASPAVHVLRIHYDFALRSDNNFNYSRFRFAAGIWRKIDVGNDEFYVAVRFFVDGRWNDAADLRRFAADRNLFFLYNRRRFGQRLHKCGGDEFSKKNLRDICDESFGNFVSWMVINYYVTKKS